MSGHGISEAVRNHISTWITNDTVKLLYKEYSRGRSGQSETWFNLRVRNSDEWKRESRKKTSSGWERNYRCRTLASATLVVHSPTEDMSADSYVICIDGKAVAGGKTKLKSVQINETISKDKTESKYTAASAEELREFNMRVQFGDGFEYFETERVE